MPDLRITCLRRDEAEGFWRARVTANGGPTVAVDRRFGSWRTSAEPHRFVLPAVATALQARVRPIEKAERRGAEEVAA